LLGTACCPTPVRPENLATPTDLPDEVVLRTSTEAFNERWYFALREGRIWVKPNPEHEANTNAPDDWELLGETGLPEGCKLDRFDPPQALVSISADGVHLQALSDEGVFYRATDMTKNTRDSVVWTDRWGWPAANGPGLEEEFSSDRGWAVSDSHPFGVDHYEDALGIEHSVGLGVAHLYRLGPQGERIYYNDWWLPADWSRQVCGPQRGTFQAVNISASASTLFVIDARGRMYTRLYDFDTAGENDLLTYSYIIEERSSTTRKLPAEPWRRQPDIPGEASTLITIFQTGEGNAARTLHVAGTQGEQTGYFHKNIDDDTWTFTPWNIAVDDHLLTEFEHVETPTPDDAGFTGDLLLDGRETHVEVELLDFNGVCSPARARLWVDGELATNDGQPVVLQFHHVHGLVKDERPTDYWQQGMAAKIRAALLLPAGFPQVDDPGVEQRLRDLFQDRAVINFMGSASRDAIELEEIPRHKPFLVPGREKARSKKFQLRLSGSTP